MPRHLLWVYLLLLSLPYDASAQEEGSYELEPFLYHETFNVHVTASVGIPSRDLSKAIYNKFGNLGIGLSAGAFFNPFGKKKTTPVMPGIDFNYFLYGVDVIPESTDRPRIKTVFNVYAISAGIRAIPFQDKAFIPFFDGMIGSKIFNTRTKAMYDEPEVIHTTNDAGLTYILGAGFYVRHPKPAENEMDIAIMLRFLYFWGTDTKYVKRDSFEIDGNNNITFETARTTTSMFNIQLGIVIR